MNIKKTHLIPRNILVIIVLASLVLSLFGFPTGHVAAQVPAPDLIVTSVEVFPSGGTIYTNDDIDFIIHVKNNGDAAAAAFTVSFFIDEDADNLPDTTTCSATHDFREYHAESAGLAAGAQEDWYITVPAGSYLASVDPRTLTVYVDSGCVVAESDEANIFEQPFTISDPVSEPPLNDNIASFITDDASIDDYKVASLPYKNFLDANGATRDPEEPSSTTCQGASYTGLASVWYKYTPASNVSVFADTFGTTYDTYLAVWDWTAGGNALTSLVGCNDDYNAVINNDDAGLSVNLTAGHIYYFEVAQVGNDNTNVENQFLEGDVGAQEGGRSLYFNITLAHTISGNVGIPGVTLSYIDGDVTKTVTSDSNGNYTITIPDNWTGTVTPSLPNAVFTPTNRSYDSAVTTDLTDQNFAVEVTVVLQSAGGYDGWIRESSETSSKGGTINKRGKIISLGDDQYNRQYRGILSFNTSSIPGNATIVSVKLKFKYAGKAGTLPFTTHNKLRVDIRNGAYSGNNALQKSDFQVSSTRNNIMVYGSKKYSGWYVKGMSSSYFNYINRNGPTQFRLRFAKDDNNDYGTDLLKIYSGNAGSAARPQLIIVYTITP